MNKLFKEKLAEIKKKLDQMPASEEKTYACPRCQDRGMVLIDNLAYPCDCVQKKRRENLCKHARLSGQYRHKHFEDFDINYYATSPLKSGRSRTITYRQLANDCLQAAKNFSAKVIEGEDHKGMYIYGSVGSGKTLLASCMANVILEAGLGLLFVSVPDLLDELKDTFGSRERKELDLMKEVREVDVLIMDDLGAHQYTDWTAGRIYNIINYRAAQGLSTVITSNLSVDELSEALDLRTSSRILQLCQIYRLETKEDIRRQVYKEKLRKNLTD